MPRRKARLGLDIREGGIAIPIAPNMYYMDGRSHDNGGIAIGPNNKNGLEVEGGEVVKVGNNDIKVFSSVPLLRGVSPAQLVLGGANPNKVFKAQEEFKDRNRINDDGTRYEVGGEKIYTPSKVIQRQLQETGKVTIGGAPTIGGLRTFGYLRGLANAAKYGNAATNIFRAGKELIKRGTEKLVDSGKITRNVAQIPRSVYSQFVGVNGQNLPRTINLFTDNEKKAGGIYIKPSKRGTFTAAASKHNMGVQEFASKVLANKEDYSPAMVKKANFARNASRWKKEYGGEDDTKTAALKRLKAKHTIKGIYGGGESGGAGAGSVIMELPEYVNDTITKRYLVPVTQNFNDAFGDAVNAGLDKFMFDKKWYTTEKGNNPNNNAAGATRTQTVYLPVEHKEVSRRKKELGGNMIYTINGNVKNRLMNVRPKAQYGKTIKINRNYYETVDEAIERYKQLYRIKYGKEPSKTDVDRVAWVKTLETAITGDPNLITGYGPNVGVRGPNVTKIVSGANKGKQIARTQTAVRNKNIKSAMPERQAINTKVSQAARNERLSQFEKWQQGEAFKASTMPTDAVAVSRQPISTGVRSGRKGRVDDVVAIERSQRSVDPLSSKSEFSVYDKAYAKRANNKMNQFSNVLLASGTGGIIGGSMAYDDIVDDTINNEELPIQNHVVVNNNQTNKSVNSNNETQNKISNNNVKTTTNIKTINNDYVSTTKPNTEESYVINPLTGEWIRNGVIETSEPSIKGITKIGTQSSSTPRRGESKSAVTTKSKTEPAYINYTPNKVSLAVEADNPTSRTLTKIDTPSTGGGTQSKDGRWVGQYNTTNVGDWIGLGSNLAGSVASYFMTKSAIDKMPKPVKPVMARAAKLKTKYNINPQLTEIGESEQVNRATVRRNTQSSKTSIAREQRLLNEARTAKNVLYGQKENIETQLINQDKLNRQQVAAKNVAAYNDYLNRIYANKVTQNQGNVSNINNFISGLTGGVTSILGNIENRRMTNNSIRAIAAANPNVDARLIGGFDYYIDPVSKKKYNKNQQYVGTING